MKLVLVEGEKEKKVLARYSMEPLRKELPKPSDMSDEEYFYILMDLATFAFAINDEKFKRMQKLIPPTEGETDEQQRLKLIRVIPKLVKLNPNALQTVQTWPDSEYWPDEKTKGRNQYIIWLLTSGTPPFPEDALKLKKYFEYTKTPQAKSKGINFDFSKKIDEILPIAKEFTKDPETYKTNRYEELKDGYRIYHVSKTLDPIDDVINDARIEGCSVGHCLGWKKLSGLNTDSDFFSLRGPDNKSHVTLYYNRKENRFYDIQGRSGIPNEKYIDLLVPWLAKKFPLSSLDGKPQIKNKVEGYKNKLKLSENKKILRLVLK